MKVLNKSLINRFKKWIPLPYCKDSNTLESCKKCNNNPCISICPTNIIIKEENRIYLDFKDSGCIFCKKCAEICQSHSLGLLDLSLENYINAKISLNEAKCLAWNKTICSYCADVCDNKSIKFNAMLYPEILESCTKCGMCQSVCPKEAITFRGV